MSDETDRELRERFHALRREAGGGTPAFGSTVAALAGRRQRARRLRRWVSVIAASAATAIVLFVVRGPGGPDGKRAVLVNLAARRWEAPTDFLLRTPGAELLRTIPTFITPEGRFVP